MRTLIATALLLATATITFGQASSTTAPKRSFAGTFVLAGASGDLRFDAHSRNQPVLQILQTAGDLQITRTTDGGREKMILPFDGREVSYTTTRGVTAKATLKVKGADLEVQKDIPQEEIKVHIHSVEHWKLTRDSKTLKICGYADSLGGIVEFRISGCQVFKRQ
ncbi:MAG TPA: hypothetical protein VGR94_07060 [Candidatus Acidoferrales bacterium]|nr:hypothetical protein [Candidatus Acidoferrales bacterium]